MIRYAKPVEPMNKNPQCCKETGVKNSVSQHVGVTPIVKS